MKTALIVSICTLAAAGLAVWLTLERQAGFKLDQENKALRQQLSQMEELVAEKQRLTNLVAAANGSPSRPNEQVEDAPATDEKELVWLRAKVEALRQQRQEIERVRAETRELRAAREAGLNTPGAVQAANSQNGTAADRLEILTAEYWTAGTNLDVAEELRERIRGGKLRAIASNSLKGDPEFGQVKHLTIIYRLGGATLTNEFREGEFVEIPKQQE